MGLVNHLAALEKKPSIFATGKTVVTMKSHKWDYDRSCKVAILVYLI